MHNLTKIRLFRILLWITYPVSLIFIYPIVLLSRKKLPSLVFFFDRYVLGGAQRVHLDILESVSGTHKDVYFTRYSPNDKLKAEFWASRNTRCRDIHIWCDFLLFRLFTVHYYAFLINRHRPERVFSANSTFFYDLLPFISKKVVRMELLHNFSYGKKGMEFFGLANYQYLDRRLVIDEATRRNIIMQYRDHEVPERYASRIQLIEFGVPLPKFPVKDKTPPLKVLYAGRGSAQKRIWLLNKIVEFFIDSDNKVEFIFAGSMADELSAKVKQHCRIVGEVGSRDVMENLLDEAHAIILTSAFEGFPVIVKEGMAHGCVPVVTALEGNKTHLTHLTNALLIEYPESEESVVAGGIRHIQLLLSHPELLASLSKQAYNYAAAHFRREQFLTEYRKLLT